MLSFFLFIFSSYFPTMPPGPAPRAMDGREDKSNHIAKLIQLQPHHNLSLRFSSLFCTFSKIDNSILHFAHVQWLLLCVWWLSVEQTL